MVKDVATDAVKDTVNRQFYSLKPTDKKWLIDRLLPLNLFRVFPGTAEQMMEMSELELFQNLAKFLSPQDRVMLFHEYCNILRNNIPEKVWLETGIRKTDVYRYFPKEKSKRGGFIPSSYTTAKVIIALIRDHRKYDLVISVLEKSRHTMHITYLKFDDWVRIYRHRQLDYSTLNSLETLANSIRRDMLRNGQ